MKSKRISIIFFLVFGQLVVQSVALAHESKVQNKKVTAVEQMKKLHAIMPVFSVASAQLESALEKGDAVAAKVQADRILAAIPDLKKSKPHKNVNQLKKFRELAANLENAVTETVALAQKDDFAGAAVKFIKVEAVCAACHAKFRD